MFISAKLINGAKSSKTTTRVFSAPTEGELLEERDEANEEIEASIEDAIEKADALRKEMEAFQERLREEREMDWQDKRALEDLLEKQQELKETIENVRKENEKKKALENKNQN